MKVKKVKQSFLRSFGNLTLIAFMEILFKTLKIEYHNRETIEKLENEKQNFVLAFWHGTMLVSWYVNKNKNFAALTSKSKDGDLLARVLKHLNYEVVRGSSSDGGDVALGIMIDYAKNGYSVALTPDGPRGPAHKFKAGAAITAKKSEVPLVLCGVGISKKKHLKSWDKFEVPGFFSKICVLYSDPLHVSTDLNYEDTSEFINQCEIKLNQLQLNAQKLAAVN